MAKKHENLTKEEMLQKLQTDVFDSSDFKRQLEETAIKLNLPKDVVSVVVIDYIKRIGIELVQVKRRMRRIVIYGWCMIDILEERYYKFNKIKSKRYE